MTFSVLKEKLSTMNLLFSKTHLCKLWRNIKSQWESLSSLFRAHLMRSGPPRILSPSINSVSQLWALLCLQNLFCHSPHREGDYIGVYISAIFTLPTKALVSLSVGRQVFHNYLVIPSPHMLSWKMWEMEKWQRNLGSIKMLLDRAEKVYKGP